LDAEVGGEKKKEGKDELRREKKGREGGREKNGLDCELSHLKDRVTGRSASVIEKKR